MKKFLFVTMVLALTFNACDDKPDTHTHTWSDWQSNAEQHWKECSCGEKTDIGNHTGNPCTVCGYEEIATVPQPTQKILSFGKVTISSENEHLPSAWNALCNDIVNAFESTYENIEDTFDFDLVGNEGDGIQIVLKNDLAKNWEVKSGVKYGTLYIKTDSILSITVMSYEAAMLSVAFNNPNISVD